jgi:hypothetical protein
MINIRSIRAREGCRTSNTLNQSTRALAVSIMLKTMYHLMGKDPTDLMPCTIFAVHDVLERQVNLLMSVATEGMGYAIHRSEYQTYLLDPVSEQPHISDNRFDGKEYHALGRNSIWRVKVLIHRDDRIPQDSASVDMFEEQS